MSSQIDALARFLERDPSLNGEASDETRSLGALAQTLEASAARPEAEFKADLRATLVEAAREQAAAPPPLLTRLRESLSASTARWRYSTGLATTAAVAAIGLSGGGFAYAAEHSVPGDLLYPVKQAYEGARLALSTSDEGRGEQQLSQTTERITEAERALDKGNTAAATTALVAADVTAREGAGDLIRAYQASGDGAVLETVSGFVDEARPRAGALDAGGGEAGTAQDALLVAFERIEARLAAVAGTCESCEDGEVPALGTAFDFGAIPHASEPFEACPCRPAPEPPEPTDEPEAAEPEADGPDADGVPAPDADAPEPVVPDAGQQPAPDAQAPSPGGEPGVDVPVDRQPLRERVPSSPSVPQPNIRTDDPTGTIDDTVDDVLREGRETRDRVNDTVDDTTDRLRDTTRDATDSLRNTTDDVRDTTDGLLP
jgi:hypothetical protein